MRAGSDPNFQGAKGLTALHYMLKKNSDKSHYGMFVEHGAGGDIRAPDGETASAILRRKRDPYFGGRAEQLASN